MPACRRTSSRSVQTDVLTAPPADVTVAVEQRMRSMPLRPAAGAASTRTLECAHPEPARRKGSHMDPSIPGSNDRALQPSARPLPVRRQTSALATVVRRALPVVAGTAAAAAVVLTAERALRAVAESALDRVRRRDPAPAPPATSRRMRYVRRTVLTEITVIERRRRTS